MAVASSFADSLTLEDIPQKFRCALGSHIAADPLRLPCCGQAICSTCHNQLPEICPLCSHSPLSKGDCTPHKNLRASIKTWLNKEEKKRQKTEAPQYGSKADLADKSEEVEDIAVSDPQPLVANSAIEDQGPSETVATVDGAVGSAGSTSQWESAASDEKHEQPLPTGDAGDVEDDGSDVSSVLIRVSPPPQDPNELSGNDNNNPADGTEQQKEDMSFSGQDGTNYNTMNNFRWGTNGSMNGMNPMMAMQNGMAGFQQFPNMPGMDQMMMLQQMQQMASFGGFPNMGMMGGMNMGQMGFDNGFGNFGMPNGMSNMNMGGDWGNNNFHQGPRNPRGNYGRGRNRYNNFQRNAYRGQVHGAHGFDRGRTSSFHDHQTHGSSQDQRGPSSQEETRDSTAIEVQEQTQRNDEQPVNGPVDGRDDLGRDILKKYSLRQYTNKLEDKAEAQISAVETNVDELVNAETSDVPYDNVELATDVPEKTVVANGVAVTRDDELTKQDANTDHDGDASTQDLGPNVPQGPAAQYAHPSDFRGRGRGYTRYRGSSFDARGGSRGRGVPFNNVSVVSPVEPHGTGVIGAPTGPKALREGGPNVGFRGRATLLNTRGGRGGSFSGRNGQTAAPTASPIVEKQSSLDSRRDRSMTSEEPRSSRRRSYNMRDDEDEDYDRERNNRHRHNHKYEDNRQDGGGENDERDENISDHRSRRDKEKHRSSRHDRERSDDRRKRRHRERPYEEDEYSKSKEQNERRKSYDSGRRHHRDEHRDRRDEPRDRDTHHHSPTQTGLEARITQTKPVDTPKREFKIQGRSKQSELESRREKDRTQRSEFEIQKERIREEKPNVDVYTLEREARTRERLAKEQERRGSHGFTDTNGRKRNRDELETYDAPRTSGELEARMGRKKSKHTATGRRASHKFDDSQDVAAMVDRAERERELARY